MEQNKITELQDKIQNFITAKQWSQALATIEQAIALASGLEHTTPQVAAEDDQTVVANSGSFASADNPTLPCQCSDIDARFSSSWQRPAAKGQNFGRYEIIDEIGRGGMGRVYKAYDSQLAREVALKVLIWGDSSDSRQIERFHREARATAKLHHSNIVSIYDIGNAEGQNYFTMDFISGASLRDILRQKSLSNTENVDIMISVADAVDYAHSQGIIHRDLKPANIIIADDRQPKVMDFGLAKIVSVEDGLSRTGDVVGTPAYMSPEQADGKAVDIRTDIYALGATFYEMLTGRAPFQGESYIQLIYQILHKDPVWPRELSPGIPAELEAICLKCLEKNPDRRYQSAADLREDLSNYRQHKPIIARQPTILNLIGKFVMRHRALSISVATVLLTIVAGAIFSLYMWQMEQSQRQQVEKAKNQVDQIKQQKEIEAKEANVGLAKIALKKSEEACDRCDWAQSGVYAGAALEFIKDLGCDEALKLKDQGNTLIKLALHRYGLLWESVGYATVNHLAYSPDGHQVATSGADDRVRLWCPQTGKLVRELPGHRDRPTLLRFSPDGKVLASGATDANVRIWSVATGELLKIFTVHHAGITALTFHPDGKMIASASTDGEAYLWNIDNSKRNWLEHTGYVNALAFSPDGRTLASASSDWKLKLWDTAKPEAPRIIATPNYTVTALAFSRDGAVVMAAAKNSDKLRRWNVGDGQMLAELDGPDGVRSWQMDADASLLAIANTGGVEVRRLRQNDAGQVTGSTSLATIKLAVSDLAFAPDHGHLVCAVNGQAASLWNIEQNSQSNEQGGHSAPVVAIAFSPDGKIIASGSEDCTIGLWDALSGTKLATLSGHSQKIRNLRFSPDGRLLASTCYDRTVGLWDTAGRKLLRLIKDDSQEKTTGAVFTADSKTLIYAHWDRTIYFWDIVGDRLANKENDYFSKISALALSGKTLAVACGTSKAIFLLDLDHLDAKPQRLNGHTDFVTAMAFTPHGSSLASVSFDKTLRLWQGGKEIFKEKLDDCIHSLGFSDDGILAFGLNSETIALWDPQTRETITEIHARGQIHALAISPDGQRLATAGDNKTVCLWNCCPKRLAILAADSPSEAALTFTPGKSQVAVGIENGTISRWDNTGKAIGRMPGNHGSIKQIISAASGQQLAWISGQDNWAWIGDSDSQKIESLDQYVTALQFNATGRELVWAANKKQLKSVSFADGRAQDIYTGDVDAVALAPDGRTLALALPQQKIELVNISDGKCIEKLAEVPELVGNLAFSPDGKILAATAGKEKTVWLWRVGQDRRPYCQIVVHCSALKRPVFSPDSRLIATPYWDGTIRLWTVADGRSLMSFNGESGQATNLAFSPDQRWLASAGVDETIKLWPIIWKKTETADHRSPIILIGHHRPVTALAFSDDGRYLVSSSLDRSVGLWIVKEKSRTPLKMVITPTAVHTLEFIGPRRVVGSDAQSLYLMHVDGDNLKIVETIPNYGAPLAFGRQGKTIATRVKAKIKWRTSAIGSPATSLFTSNSYLNAIAFAHDGNWVALARGNTVHMLSISDHRLVLIGNSCTKIAQLVFSADGRILAAGSVRGVIRWWQLDSNGNKQNEQVVPAHSEQLKLLTFAHGSSWLISASGAGDIKIWEVASGKQIRQFEPIASGIVAAAFTPAGCTLATLSGDQNLSLWDVYSGRKLATLPGKYCSVAISSDGSQIVAGRSNQINCPGETRVRVELWRISGHLAIAKVTPHPSCFDFRADIPGKTIEQALKSDPRETTQHLFHGQVTATFAVEPYSHLRLWQLSKSQIARMNE